MKTNLTVLLDMDGVLCNWSSAVCRLFDRDYDDLIRNWKNPGGSIFSELGVTEEQVWEKVDAIGVDFWAGLDPLPWMEELLGVSREIARDNVFILTSPSEHPTSAAGKVMWMKEHLGKGRDFRDYLIGPQKHLCARYGSILIDDRDKHVSKFDDHGGYGILFPRPWNTLYRHASDPMAIIRAEMEDITSTEWGL